MKKESEVVFVAIHGQMRVGKDELAAAIIRNINQLSCQAVGSGYVQLNHAKRIANADILKDEAAKIFSIPRKKVFDDDYKNELTDIHDLNGKQLTWRGALQYFGSEICRTMMSDCWVRAMVIEALDDKENDIFVVPDCRFPNEIEWLRKTGKTFVVRITRPGFDGDGHVSERALDDWDQNDFIIHNDGDLNALGSKGEHLAIRILQRINGECI